MNLLNMYEKLALEEFIETGSSYIQNFSVKAFNAFIQEAKEIEIYSDEYTTHGPPKEKAGRAFLDVESGYLIGNLLNKLIEEDNQGYDMAQELANQRKVETRIDYLYDNIELMLYPNYQGLIATEQVSKR